MGQPPKEDRTMVRKEDYAPYHTMPEFEAGMEAYAKGNYRCPYQGIGEQAWDRGLEYAMRKAREG